MPQGLTGGRELLAHVGTCGEAGEEEEAVVGGPGGTVVTANSVFTTEHPPPPLFPKARGKLFSGWVMDA